MRAVNLLPKDSRGGGSLNAKNLPAVVGGGMGFVVVAALAGGFLSASSKVKAAQSDLSAAQAQLASTPVPPPAPAQTPVNTAANAVTAEQAPRLQAVSSALSQRIAWDRVLREFSMVLPTDVWILSLQMTAPATAGAANGFAVTGSTYSYDSVARMLSRMYLVPDLSGVTLTSVSGSGKLVQFSVNASIKGGAAPPAPAPAPVAPPTDTSTDSTSTDSGATS